ncbi:isoflavone reductase like P3 [Fusarium denticulatum]|uniref:Isoflavone reductase like P3 n=1 Tax=Fusarium denticulatum TaxID=48507 RepID=A0A8H5XKK7_9HYPO|nr:isoflavone reductase like P3 [Fusarium denticulatum]
MFPPPPGFATEEHLPELARASVEADVKRLIASGYGANTTNKEAVKVFPVAGPKARMIEHLKFLEQPEPSLNDILEAEQKLVGKEGWKITQCTEMMPRMLATGRLSLAVNVKEGSKANVEKRGILDNDLLRVPQESIEDVVARVKNGR